MLRRLALPKYRRRGIGQRLVQQVTVDSGHPWVITVFNDDLAARAFWAAMFSRCGFGEPEQLTDPQGRDATVHVLRPPARILTESASRPRCKAA